MPKKKKGCPVCRNIRLGYHADYAHECYTITLRAHGVVSGGLSKDAVARIFARPNGPRVIEAAGE
jgi:hypothetical protein